MSSRVAMLLIGSLAGLPLLLTQPSTSTIAVAEEAKSKPVTLQILNWEETLNVVKKHKGKIVVMDIWSTSCDPCIQEFPNLVKLHKAHSKDIACISVATDYAGSKKKPPEFYKERVLKFLTEQQATFDNILSNEPSDELFEKMELSSIPAVYVFGRDGKQVKRFDNNSAGDTKTDEEAFTYEDVNKVVYALLKK